MLGARLLTPDSIAGWTLDAEAAAQTGISAGDEVLAGFFAMDVAYEVPDHSLGLGFVGRLAAYSGGRKGDGRNETFDPLFPSGGYYVDTEVFRGSNTFGARFGVTLRPAPGVTGRLSWDDYYRASTAEGLYAVGGDPLRTEAAEAGLASSARRVGGALGSPRLADHAGRRPEPRGGTIPAGSLHPRNGRDRGRGRRLRQCRRTASVLRRFTREDPIPRRKDHPVPEFEDPDHWDKAALHYEKTAHPFTARFAESALARAPLSPDDRIVDIAAGTGALALAAARTGASVLATDFSPGMVARIAAAGQPNVEARVMDGQALDLLDAEFDAAFSIFGVIMFPDWRAGLREMARVTRPGGRGVIATWRERGAASFLLLGQIRHKLFPERESMTMPAAIAALSDPETFARELATAGFRDPQIELVTHDYELEVAALADPDTLFGMSPDWTSLDRSDRAAVVAKVRSMAGNRQRLPIPSTALIAVAER